MWCGTEFSIVSWMLCWIWTPQWKACINTSFSRLLVALSKYRVLQIGFRHCQSQGQLVSVTCELIMSVLRHFCIREPIRCGRILNRVRLIASISGCFTLFLSNFHVVAHFISVQYVSVIPPTRLTNCAFLGFQVEISALKFQNYFCFLKLRPSQKWSWRVMPSGI
jgi:hypothetical protein